MRTQTNLMTLPQLEDAFSVANSATISAINRCLQHLPNEYRNDAILRMHQLSKGVTNYENLMTGAYNVVADDCVELIRQRDYLMCLVQRMAATISDNDIDCMRPYILELYHLFLEGMFFTEKGIPV